MIRDAAISLALANLLFYPVWSELLPGSYGHYFLKAPPSLNMQLGMMLVVLFTALCFGLGAFLARRFPRPVLSVFGKAVFLVFLVLALNGVRYHLMHYSSSKQAHLFSTLDSFLFKPAALLFFLLLLTRWRQSLIRGALRLMLALLPFAVLTFSQTAWAVVKLQIHDPFPGFQNPAPAPALEVRPKAPRVLFLLFDGLDQHLAFEARPEDVEMPHLDRFREQAVQAVSAHPPAGNTLLSIPALLTGRPLESARPFGPSDLLIQFSDTGKNELWSQQPNLFSKARQIGCNTALIGYYHPYCRIFRGQVTACFWTTDRWGSLRMDDPKATVPEAVGRLVSTETQRLAASLPFVWRFGFFRSAPDASQNPHNSRLSDHIQNHLDILETARRWVADPGVQLLYVHWPVPHHPYIYDRKINDFRSDREGDYLDNLELADRTVAEIMDALRVSGLEDRTTVLITSDHWLDRSNRDNRRVPFLLKLPHQTRAVSYGPAWNTLGCSELLLALLAGEVSDPTGVIRRMDQIRAGQER